ncbi:hypothetical protein BDQ17DRAFT_1432191 [Cyathus striatus]|nr:hypothetical protein BDQ17DRAFT_1432191 [Cyathus striatus]
MATNENVQNNPNPSLIAAAVETNNVSLTLMETTTVRKAPVPVIELSDSDSNNSDAANGDSGAKNVEETAQDELKQLMCDWNSPIYALWHPVPTIGYDAQGH